MSTPSKQPPSAAAAATSTQPGAPPRRPSMNPPKTTPSRSPSRSTVTTTPSSSATPSRAKSVRTPVGGAPPSARAAVKKPATSTSTSQTTKSAMADAKAEAAAAIDDLRERLQKAELAAEEAQRQNAVMQARLDDANKEHSSTEDSMHEQTERLEELENEKKESIRQRREFEAIYEAERAQSMKEKEELQVREEELRDTIQRLKETMAQKEMRGEDERRQSISRASSYRTNASPNQEGGQFAPPSSLQRSDSSRSSSRLVLQKDKIIESLRLELAESQIKLVEMENMGGGRMQELEKTLMETRVANARLMEDNESFQLLLSEKTLNGDFSHSGLLRPPSIRSTSSRPSSPSAMAGAATLADELENASDDGTADNRRLQADLNSMRDQNKALTLYINNIISRLLQHKEFENILDKTPNLMSGADDSKALPKPPPPEKDEQPSLLKRATSVVRGGRPKPIETHSEPQPTLNEDPNTAPRIPLTRTQSNRMSLGGAPASHRRSGSEFGNPATLVNNMYRGPSPGSGPTSPSLVPPRGSSLFSPVLPVAPAAAARVPSSGSMPPPEDRRQSMPPPALPGNAPRDSARNSVYSESGLPDNMSTVSPPRSTASSSEKPTGAIMRGAGMRPLRLVQEAKEEEDAARKAKRSSWMGWFGANNRSVSSEAVPKE
ncbi:hypothetical protein AUEXF2481DRAFT_175029 [Aureobasidium subglaciale EXF-2481]|uniref:Uncharacterized protein n=1 Tax=Aureobasidium subglaciale (strain EXF-2481) TaxID=1043005 RepID=A0A074YZ07_AURSE|nr:uncharacterized protein AUEXF2481DRAFT_175029 [Aureobasidium subglaciale EXF-2481]KAI5206310.1 hypothetical protein E4T38_03966 [Aureobasidium subglaciale]KAI5225071.1 hypothetical protein E4T40_03741 [Aureobasidium subglaciale]KAI5228736.1 hypothetical protein E4T41_03806 [Aureobasidium subglaciale]KAI5263781.1 hypothetical protein E4T46_03582 [Aureobasidium subglaciale]KEQ99397.1 hypothetical protein AUEXF2481DRAFT_175029 [Aureobasidium subglaciale EXF-2481]